MRVLFDIGGTNTRVGISRTGRNLDDLMIYKTPWKYEKGMDKLVAGGLALARGKKIKSVIGGVAGILSLDGKSIFVSPNLPRWSKRPVRADLERAFGCGAAVANDAALAGLGEAHYGAGKGYGIMAYLTVSTGIGGCRVTGGELDKSHLGFEPGHQIVAYKGGKLKYFEPYTDNRKLAVGLHNAVVFWSPEIIVMGGGRMKDPRIRISELKRQLKRTLAFYPRLPQIKKAELGDLSGLYGALVLSRRGQTKRK